MTKEAVARAISSLDTGPDAAGEVGVRPLFSEGHTSASPVCAEPAQTESGIILPPRGREAEARSAEDDARISLHEASHVTVGRLLGQPLGGVTIVETDRYGGLTWGPTYQSRFTPGPPVSSLTERIVPLLPRLGENRECISEIVLHCHNRVVELCAGSCGEQLFLGSAWDAVDDRKQERALASLVAGSPDAIEAFIAFARCEAMHLLRAHEHVVVALTNELLIKRTLDGGEIDQIIRDAVAAKAQSDEHARRIAWKCTEANAANFSRWSSPSPPR
jgi:hypothetical protein